MRLRLVMRKFGKERRSNIGFYWWQNVDAGKVGGGNMLLLAMFGGGNILNSASVSGNVCPHPPHIVTGKAGVATF